MRVRLEANGIDANLKEEELVERPALGRGSSSSNGSNAGISQTNLAKENLLNTDSLKEALVEEFGDEVQTLVGKQIVSNLYVVHCTSIDLLGWYQINSPL